MEKHFKDLAEGVLIALGVMALINFLSTQTEEQKRNTDSKAFQKDFENISRDFDVAGSKLSSSNSRIQ